MRLADVILRIKIIKNEHSLVLTQLHYIERNLKKFNYYDCKSMSYPNTGKTVS